MDKSRCKFCDKEIIWRHTKSGKATAFECPQIPVIVDAQNGNHWAWVEMDDSVHMIRKVRTCSESCEAEKYVYGHLSHLCKGVN